MSLPGLPYDGVEGGRLAQEVLALVNYTSKLASVELARARGGCPAVVGGRFRYADPAFLRRFADLEVDSVSRGDWAALADEIAATGQLWNSSTIAVPPTGPSAPVVCASTGIEPLFRLADALPDQQRKFARSLLDMRMSSIQAVFDGVSSYVRDALRRRPVDRHARRDQPNPSPSAERLASGINR